MRVKHLAAGVLTLAVAGYPAIGSLASHAAAASARPFRTPASVLTFRPQSADDQQSVPDSSQTLKVQTNLVNVFVTARDKKNSVLTDLKQEDFKIYEDGMEQKVAFFSKDMNLPITLAILIDTSGSMQNILGAEQ